MSELVKIMIDEDDEDDKQDIPLPNVKSQILGKVLEFCKYYVKEPMINIPKPLPSVDMREVVGEWYANYVKVEHEVLIQIMIAANYMDIEPLLDLTTATVASYINGQPPDKVAKTFNITESDDGRFTHGNVDCVKEENTWVYEDMTDEQLVDCLPANPGTSPSQPDGSSDEP